MDSCDVIIIGAGPYGLSAAAHLSTIRGLDVRVFGQPMSFWDKNMPVGMLLRSNWTATQIAGPGDELTLEAFRDETKRDVTTPVPLAAFVEYGLWYQRKAVPEVDARLISRVEAHSGRFHVYPETGSPVDARRVVVAAGIGAFVRRPAAFSQLPSALVTHTSEHRDLGIFRGKSVLVIGSGQSALESGALLRESGASIEILGRSEQIHWLQGRLSRTLHHGLGKTVRAVLYAPTDVGPAGLSQLLARPHLLPEASPVPSGSDPKTSRPTGRRALVGRSLEGNPDRTGSSGDCGKGGWTTNLGPSERRDETDRGSHSFGNRISSGRLQVRVPRSSDHQGH